MRRLKVAVAGASGYIGSCLIEALLPHYDVIALSRSPKPDSPGLEWRYCDLYSLLQAEMGLQGADLAFYLVHSMLPSAHLSQGHFSDMDLILADNFARACQLSGVEQIIYLGGIIPEGADLSSHLRSRLEVERTLADYRIPVTAIRASIIVGAKGSSFQMIEKLVRRLPVMLCPPWTCSKTQPIALDDVIQILVKSLGQKEFYWRFFDVGGPNVLSYLELMQVTAQVMGLKRLIIPVPWMSNRMSCWSVSLIARAPHELVNPLVESLKHPMVAHSLELQEQLGIEGMDFVTAVKKALEAQSNSAPALKTRKQKPKYTQSLQFSDEVYPQEEKIVRSVQRLPLPAGKNALWIAEKYTLWLPRFLHPFVRVEVDTQRTCSFFMLGIKEPLLILKFSVERSDLHRTLFYITGGLLASRKTRLRGRLEFREVLGKSYVIAAIHDFSPSLPWFIYNWTQAQAHLWVMHGFRKYLRSLDVLH
jgi:uncharacterized protein YbjT (DUF2867 family)